MFTKEETLERKLNHVITMMSMTRYCLKVKTRSRVNIYFDILESKFVVFVVVYIYIYIYMYVMYVYHSLFLIRFGQRTKL